MRCVDGPLLTCPHHASVVFPSLSNTLRIVLKVVLPSLGIMRSEIFLHHSCTEVKVEPPLQTITSETLSEYWWGNNARLDIVLGSQYERTFFDVWVFNPYAPFNQSNNSMAPYKRHETLHMNREFVT